METLVVAVLTGIFGIAGTGLGAYLVGRQQRQAKELEHLARERGLVQARRLERVEELAAALTELWFEIHEPKETSLDRAEMALQFANLFLPDALRRRARTMINAHRTVSCLRQTGDEAARFAFTEALETVRAGHDPLMADLQRLVGIDELTTPSGTRGKGPRTIALPPVRDEALGR